MSLLKLTNVSKHWTTRSIVYTLEVVSKENITLKYFEITYYFSFKIVILMPYFYFSLYFINYFWHFFSWVAQNGWRVWICLSHSLVEEAYFWGVVLQTVEIFIHFSLHKPILEDLPTQFWSGVRRVVKEVFVFHVFCIESRRSTGEI